MLCATGYNIRWLLRAIVRLGLKGLFVPLLWLLLTMVVALTPPERTRKNDMEKLVEIVG